MERLERLDSWWPPCGQTEDWSLAELHYGRIDVSFEYQDVRMSRQTLDGSVARAYKDRNSSLISLPILGRERAGSRRLI
jgi:hypothetical protein